MPDQVNLRAQRRTVTGKKVRQLRREGKMPANLYGGHDASIPLQVDSHELETLFKKHGPTTLYRLVIAPDGMEQTALVRHVQREPVTGAIEHVDFLHVAMNQSIHARIPLRLQGEAPAVKIEGGVLLHPVDTLEVEALPANLPEFVEVDISRLTELNSSLYVRDVHLPPRVKLLSPEDEVVVSVTAPRTPAAEAEAAVPAEVAETPTAETATAEGETTTHAKQESKAEEKAQNNP